MSRRRQWMILVLILLVFGPILGGFGIGEVELLVWVLLLACWAWLFVTWAGNGPRARD